LANANSTLGQNYLLPRRSQQFDDKHPDTFTLQKKHLFDRSTFVFDRILKSCVKAQMNRLSALCGQMWNAALYGTQHLSEEKEEKRKQNKRKDHKL
jgi:hypothetical protein